MWECISHSPPWAGIAPDKKVWSKVAQGDRPPVPPAAEAVCPPGWCVLMQLCWQQDPATRPELHHVLKSMKDMLAEYRSGSSASHREGLIHDASGSAVGSNSTGSVQRGVPSNDLESFSIDASSDEPREPLLDTYYSCDL